MSVAGTLTRPCTIRRRTDSGEVNDYGDPTLTTVEVETVCEIQQRQRDEGGDQGEMSDAQWLAVFPAGTVIGSADTVTVDDTTYEIVGAPWPVWDRLVGAVDHLECTLRRTA